ncbi:MAG TPA: DUF1802 family protein [Capsulimonadaceae bacterium]|jgi:hypothetical protein
MLPETISIALKEWAVVQRAMLENHQILLLRKGGLIEESGEFDLKARDFLILPTFIHETERAGDVQPCFLDWLRDEEAKRPAPNRIRFEAACHVTDIVRAESRDALKKLAPQHIWSDQFIDGRYDWEPYKPVFALICRAYRLESPVTVPFEDEYGGCKSWIELREPISTLGAVPAMIGDDEYAKRADLTAAMLR